MFSNQIATRELFNGNQSLQEQSHQNDFSQLQNVQFTQFDMSQPYSQDYFSQEQNSVSSNSQSQGLRAPGIEKYMPKPSLFRNQSQSRISTLSRPDQDENQIRNANVRSNSLASFDNQQLSKQKIKAKERDERDLLNSIVSMVRECTDEVKQNMKYISSAEADNADIFQSSIRPFSESLEESSRKILKAIEVKNEHSNIISALERKLAQRDERILELLQKKHNSDEDSSRMLNSLKSFILDQQSETELKILKILESTQEQLKATKELGNSHKMFCEVNSKQYTDVKNTNAKQTQEVEKRLVEELNIIRKDFERQRSDFEVFFQNQILSVHQEHLIALQQHVENGMIERLSQIPDKSNDIIDKWHSKLKTFCKSQQRDTEKYIQYQTTEQTKQILKETQDTYSRQQRIINKEISDTLEDFKAELKQVVSENMDCLKELKHAFLLEGQKRPWQNENVPKAVQDKLDELHNYHQSEIKRLEAEIESQQKKSDTPKRDDSTKNDAENAVNYILQNVFNLQQNSSGRVDNDSCSKKSFTSMFKNGPGLLSPRPPKGTAWNSRALFGRCNPSPIATVLPQRKQTHEDLVCTSGSTQVTGVIEDQNMNARVLRNRSVGISNIPNVLKVSNSVGNTPVPSADGKKKRKQVKKKKAVTSKTKSTGYPSSDMKKRKVNELSNRKNTIEKIKKIEDICNNDSHDNESEHTGKIIPIDKKEWSNSSQTRKICHDDLSGKSIFEFRDETSPGPGLMIQRIGSSCIEKQDARNESRGQWLAASNSDSDRSSANSSPSFSVTDIFIQRQVQARSRSTDRKDNHTAHDIAGFYCSSNLTEKFADFDQQFVSTKSKRMLQDVRPLSRVAGKRKFYDFEN